MQQQQDASSDGATPTVRDLAVSAVISAAMDGRWSVGVLTPLGVGDDWTPAGVVDAIRRARYVHWSPGLVGHDLVVEVSGRPYRFQVRQPAAAVTA